MYAGQFSPTLSLRSALYYLNLEYVPTLTEHPTKLTIVSHKEFFKT